MPKKLFIRVWLGNLPPWYDQWRAHVDTLHQYGFDFMVVNNYDFLKERCRRTLGITIAPFERIAGTRKAGDFDPAYGEIFAEEIKGYDFWGHTGLDCAYGRLDRYMTDEFLADCDIFGNDPGAICGPFSLYRNVPKVNSLFRRQPQWREILEDATMYGFDEIQFNQVVQEFAQTGDVRFKSGFFQSHDKQPQHLPHPRLRIAKSGALIDTGLNMEIMMFHFNRKVNDEPFGGRRWPISES